MLATLPCKNNYTIVGVTDFALTIKSHIIAVPWYFIHSFNLHSFAMYVMGEHRR